MAASRTDSAAQLTMHMYYTWHPGPFMQIIDILGNDQNLTGIQGRKLCKRHMRRIWRRPKAIRASRIVKAMHQIRITRKPVRGRHILKVILRPQPVGIAKRAKPAFRRNACAGQDDNIHETGLTRNIRTGFLGRRTEFFVLAPKHLMRMPVRLSDFLRFVGVFEKTGGQFLIFPL